MLKVVAKKRCGHARHQLSLLRRSVLCRSDFDAQPVLCGRRTYCLQVVSAVNGMPLHVLELALRRQMLLGVDGIEICDVHRDFLNGIQNHATGSIGRAPAPQFSHFTSPLSQTNSSPNTQRDGLTQAHLQPRYDIVAQRHDNPRYKATDL
jgi:hypothetical protein